MRFGFLFVVFLLFSAFPCLSCGDEGRKNCSENGTEDCQEGEECHYYGNKPDDWYCFLPCAGDGDCPDGQSCDPGPSSCPTCMDVISVCM